ncbi:hypothetical protein V8E36_009262 [Tilletia maclaganii]
MDTSPDKKKKASSGADPEHTAAAAVDTLASATSKLDLSAPLPEVPSFKPSASSLPYTAAAQAALFAKQDKPSPAAAIASGAGTAAAAAAAAAAVPTRTAVLFLGKDWERWHRYDRDSSLQLGWQPRGVASAVTDCRSSPVVSSSSSSSDSEEEYVRHASVFSSDDDEEDGDAAAARRMSSSQSSSAGHPNEDVFSLQRRITKRARLLSSTSTSTILESTSSRPHSPAPFPPSPHVRERRYSSNGPEAAFLRHETVIGIHTPRSQHSASPASSSGCHTPSERRFSLAPLTQLVAPSSSSRSNSASQPDNNKRDDTVSSSSRGVQASRSASTQTVNPDSTPAARKLTLADAPSRKQSHVSKLRGVSASGSTPRARPGSSSAKREKRDQGASRSHSAGRRRPRRIHLAPAERCLPVQVEGTLYDEEGPFAEGAVQDGLSVRIFNGTDVPCSRSQTRSGANHLGLDVPDCGQSGDDPTSSGGGDGGESQDQGPGFITYLITTPDNRVSSAAKLRRWAMDSNGTFYAAMELKSVEAKLRAGGALPDTIAFAASNKKAGMSFEQNPMLADEEEAIYHSSRELIRSMQETYVKDIITEIQKAQTLNPDRSTVRRLLQTEDGKYIRLEEEYPEEVFFVLVGCEDHELYPVAALVFVQALRVLARFHDAGWLHGDVKLENLMFDHQGRLVVIDYENANVFRKPRRQRGAVTTTHQHPGRLQATRNGRDLSPHPHQHQDDTADAADQQQEEEGEDEEHLVRLISYDWIPPEASGPGHGAGHIGGNNNGRMMGPSGDLWALGCNLVRAFALRDGIPDVEVREVLLGTGQRAFFKHRANVLAAASRNGQDQATTTATAAAAATQPSTPAARILKRFEQEAPKLMRFVLARCITPNPAERGWEAEAEGLALAEELETERVSVGGEGGGESVPIMEIAQEAVRKAIEMSGSMWVRPKLEEARRSLGFGGEWYDCHPGVNSVQ